MVIIVTSRTSLKRIVISNSEFEGLRLAMLEDDQLFEVYLEEADEESLTGSIYLGRVENIVPNLQAAFVNIGEGRNAFLRERDLYAPKPRNGSALKVEMLKQKQKIMVQVKKDAMGLKGPQVTSYISLAGRYLVLMPQISNIGVSKKIEDPKERKRLHNIAREISKGQGVIVRTVAEGVEKEKLEEEIESLREKWLNIQKRFKHARKPQVLYEDPGVLEYILRERLDDTVDEIITDDEKTFETIKKVVESYKPKHKPIIRLINGDAFRKMGVEKQIMDSLSRVVKLPSGGVLYFDPTEALLVIDVNSGSNTSGIDSEDLILKTNIESAREIPRQLRLRNESGIIIVDFIDMAHESERQLVMHVLEEELKKDKVKTSIVEFSKLGLLEMTRKRTSPPLRKFYETKCPVCGGKGSTLSPIHQARNLIHELEGLKGQELINAVEISAHEGLKAFVDEKKVQKISKDLKIMISISYDNPYPFTYTMRYKHTKKKGNSKKKKR